MLEIKPTENLTGVSIQGDFDDLYELVDSIYNMAGTDDNQFGPYFGVNNRLLGMCYDIRHAYQGDRNVFMKDNGMNDESMKWHGMVTPEKNVYYSAEILFPEAMFIAIAVPKIYDFAWNDYSGGRSKNTETHSLEVEIHKPSRVQFSRDRANLDVLCAGILQAFEIAVGNEDADKLLRAKERSRERYEYYATLYIDKCNIELLKTPVEKRKNKLISITKRIITAPQSYRNMKDDMEYSARMNACSIYELQDPNLVYPDEIIW